MPNWRIFKPLAAALLSGILVFGSPGLASYEAFAGVVTQTPVGQGSAMPVVPGLGAVPSAAPLTLSAPTLSLAPGVLSTLPSVTPVLPRRGEAAAPAVVNAAVGLPAAPAAAPTALALALPAAAMPAARQALAAPAVLETAAPAEARGRAPKETLAALRTLKTGLSGKAAEASSRLFFDGGAAADSAPAAVREAEKELPAPRRGGLRKMMGGAAAGATLFAVGGQPIFAAASATSWLGVLHFVGASGYLLANVLAFAFPLPQIYKTFKEGGTAGVPVWRAAVGMSASLALGVVTAPLAGQLFWGVQNIFGALTLIAPVVIGKLLARRGAAYSPKGAAAMTALTAALLAAPSYGLYVAAKAFLAPLLGSLMGGAGLCALTLGLQVATGAMFFLLFVPDIVSIMKGRAPRGFTSLFSLLFFITASGFIAWTIQMAVDAPAGSSARLQYAVYAAQNAAYAVVSFLSWFHIRKGERAKKA